MVPVGDGALVSSPPGGRIEIRVTREHGQVVLAVEDTGAGMSGFDAFMVKALPPSRQPFASPP
jgi:K+-sensing histidine kinase KdpD